jgi:RING finger and CHY zinc finger domain-containing protein 1
VVHCFTCGYCIPNSQPHKCLKDVATSPCPVCLEELLYSTKGYISLKCGHIIHLKCWNRLKSINCPTCGMANFNMDDNHKRIIEAQIAAEAAALPESLKNRKTRVICNECLFKTEEADFNFVAIKCGKCGSYNTKEI